MREVNQTSPPPDPFLQQCFPGVSFGAGVQAIRAGSITIGAGTCIGDNAWLNACESTPHAPSITIGKKVLVGRRSMISSASPVSIGDYCVLAPDVYVSNADHGYQDIGTPILQQPVPKVGPLVIEENCWLGIHVVVTGNLTIGRGSVVAANSVVLEDVPPFSVVAGTPARIVRMYNPITTNWDKMHSPEQVERMLDLRKEYPCPTRAELHAKLTEHCTMPQVPSIVAGNCVHLDDRIASQQSSRTTLEINHQHEASMPISNMPFILELLKQGQFERAYKECEQSLLTQPNDAMIRFAKVLSLDGLGRQEEAVAFAKKFLAEDPSNAQIRDYLASVAEEAMRSSNVASNISVTANVNTSGNNGAVASIRNNFYGSVLLNPTTLANIAASIETWDRIIGFHNLLATDEYVAYLDVWYKECLSRFGKHWFYLDIVNVLFAASKTLAPRNYLEIGVRRGRSVCTVARGNPSVNIFAFDMWQVNYAGMENPGPDFVSAELKKHGHTGRLSFVNGNSHETLPQFFRQNPGLELDMITVDGDHSEQGALQDLEDVIPHLAIGGVLVFDDIAHPAHPFLLKVWKTAIGRHPELSSFEFVESGYGVAFAIRNR